MALSRGAGARADAGTPGAGLPASHAARRAAVTGVSQSANPLAAVRHPCRLSHRLRKARWQRRLLRPPPVRPRCRPTEHGGGAASHHAARRGARPNAQRPSRAHAKTHADAALQPLVRTNRREGAKAQEPAAPCGPPQTRTGPAPTARSIELIRRGRTHECSGYGGPHPTVRTDCENRCGAALNPLLRAGYAAPSGSAAQSSAKTASSSPTHRRFSSSEANEDSSPLRARV